MIDIVIPVHGQFDLLEKCLNSIPDAFNATRYRVYIVDNQSPGDITEIKEFYDRFPVKVSYSKMNLGFPRACNMGARKGKNKLIFLLNSDVILEPGSGDQLVSNFEDQEVGVAGMKLLFADDRHAQANRKTVHGKIQHVGLSFSITAQPHHIFIGWSPDNPKVMALREVPAVTGAALMVRRSLFRNVGGLDEKFGHGTWEDVDLCFMAKTRSLKTIVDVNAVGHHYTNATASAYGLSFNLEGNKQIFYNKWAQSKLITWSDAYLL